ncbi:MAG: hypothetical protein Q4G36_07325 [Paracoccus sp. (in: a-proteobacteria)]|nr:hypothetical protein [Paracoccus sp. (in: a-proteobacteria)]
MMHGEPLDIDRESAVLRLARAVRALFGYRVKIARLEAECARLAGVAKAREQQIVALMVERDGAQSALDALVPEARLGGNGLAPTPALRALQMQLRDARSEIVFRTGLWRAAVEGAGGPDAAALGFAPLRLRGNPKVAPDAPCYVKTYRDRLSVSGLEAHRACWLELECLARLQSLDPESAAHFPRPLALEPERPELTLSWQGWSLDCVPPDRQAGIAARLAPRIEAQTAVIVAALERAGVVHLDLNYSGDNLAVDEEGRVSLIDFDIAACDETPISAPLIRRLNGWRSSGGYDQTAMLISRLLRHFCDSATEKPAPR